MKLICYLGGNSFRKELNISPKDTISILINKLDLPDKKSFFIYNDEHYCVSSILTFEEIGITFDSAITIKTNREQYLEEQRLDFNEWKSSIGCSGSPNEGDNIWNIIMIGPKDSPYAGGKFKIKITFPPEYPFLPPTYEFLTQICHINISGHTICIPSKSNPKTPVTEILGQIFMMLTSPNENNAYGQYEALYKENYSEYLSKAREMTKEFAK